jgi:hypothetical protein
MEIQQFCQRRRGMEVISTKCVKLIQMNISSVLDLPHYHVEKTSVVVVLVQFG